jgi:hypothetical protein
MSSYLNRARAWLGAQSNGMRIGVIALAVVVLVCAICSCSTVMISALQPKTPTPTHVAQQSGDAPTSAPAQATKAPTKAPAAAKSVLKMSGSGEKNSATFHVDGQWQIKYHCENHSAYLSTAPFYVNVYQSNGDPTLDSISEECAKSGTDGETIIHSGGDFYLKVLAMDKYSLEVIDIP